MIALTDSFSLSWNRTSLAVVPISRSSRFGAGSLFETSLSLSEPELGFSTHLLTQDVYSWLLLNSTQNLTDQALEESLRSTALYQTLCAVEGASIFFLLIDITLPLTPSRFSPIFRPIP